MNLKKIRDMVAGGLFIIFGFILFVSSFSISSGASLGLGPSFMPKVLSVLLFLFGIIIAFSAIKKNSLKENDKVNTEYEIEEGLKEELPEKLQEDISDNVAEEAGKSNYTAVILTLAFLLLYILLMKSIGFVITSIFYVFAQVLLFTHSIKTDKRTKILYFVISFVSAVAIYLIFTKGFSLMLPAGILG